jgi:hypothetical protein
MANTETVQRRWDDTVETKTPTGDWVESRVVPSEDRPAREADQTPLEAILPEDKPKADKAPDSDRGDGPDRAPPPPDRLHAENWTAAIKQERAKRQAFQARVTELEEQKRRLEEENASLLTVSYDYPELQEVESLKAKAKISQSEVDFAKRFGAEALTDLHRAMTKIAESGHPDFPVVWNAMCNSNDPAAVAAGFANHIGMFDQDGSIQAKAPRGLHSPPIERSARRQQPQSSQEWPSNLAGARNVGTRRGPEWSGPTPLVDIFDRGKG